MYRFYILFLFLLFKASGLFGADIVGKIIDESGNPIVDAYILKADGSFHASSNELGIFTCKDAQVGDTLVISYLGFESKQVVVEETNFNQSLTIILTDKYFELDQVHISNSIRATNQIASIDLQTNPVNSAQEILRKVPGLIIGQHAGGGKAEQLFLRGFDIDHGTDIAIAVDGIPVNMVSHAHGQGYADLHFLIPETIDKLDFGKGPYYANVGNFNTAGYVNFQTKDYLENSSISLEVGQFNTQRATALIKLLGKQQNQHAYIASAYQVSDGPFESPQNFHRLNLMGKYTANLSNNDKFSVLASFFDSEWTASGQIPLRAVQSGLITRFGAIDDTEGGYTGRTNIALNYTKNIDNESFIKNRIYFSNYHFELFSNFTFFANDLVNGDQIRQTEERNLYGLESVWHKKSQSSLGDLNYRLGAGFRHDRVSEIGLSNTLNRETTLNSLAQGAVKESNFYTFGDAKINLGNWVINPGLRADLFTFNYSDDLSNNPNALTETDLFLSPKLNILYTPNTRFQWFIKSGFGFHSNDTRVVVAQNAKETLPGAFGTDIGTIWKPSSKLWVNSALWFLHLQQEFVYVGDAGIVEPSGKTRRFGLDFGVRWQLHKNLFFNGDLTYTIARALDVPEEENLIPLAPNFTLTGGLNLNLQNGFTGGLQYRYLADRPATEDDRIQAEGYFIMDVNVNYTIKKLTFGIVVENLFNQEWNEAQFATESRLQNEPTAIEELHFTPGVPFFLRGKVTYQF